MDVACNVSALVSLSGKRGKNFIFIKRLLSRWAKFKLIVFCFIKKIDWKNRLWAELLP
jgi:hypothetical protein